MAQSALCVKKVYQGVIDEVINGVREFFLDEGIDEQVLSELRSSWESKLAQTKAIDHSDSGPGATSHHQQTQQQQQQQQQNSQPSQHQGSAAAASPVVNLVPVQITVPAQQAGGVPKTITIHVPSAALANGVAGVQLQAILSSPNAAHTFSLEASQAAEIIQRKLNQALMEAGIQLPPQLLQYNTASKSQVDGACDHSLGVEENANTALMTENVSDALKSSICEHHLQSTRPKRFTAKRKLLANTLNQHLQRQTNLNNESSLVVEVERSVLDTIIFQRLQNSQVDGSFGLGDSSDEISDDDDDDDDDANDEEDSRLIDPDEDEEEAEGADEEPLNSEDDVSDDDTGETFETDNVVVCQYDKITRVRNKWKFHLKDGIMNLKGKDYVFQKATGEGEW